MAGVTAWQTQSLKVMYYQVAGDQRSMAVLTNMGALNLYIAFVNMFQIILSLGAGLLYLIVSMILSAKHTAVGSKQSPEGMEEPSPD